MNKRTTLVMTIIVFAAICLIWQQKIKTAAPKSHRTETQPIPKQLTSQEKTTATSQLPAAPATNTSQPSPIQDREVTRSTEKVRTAPYSMDIDLVFGDVVETLNLSPADLAKVKHLMAERWEVAIDARETVTAGNHNATSRDIRLAADAAREKVDAEIEAAVGSSVSNQVKRMIETVTELNTLRVSLEPRLKQSGVPFDPQQKLIAADVIHETYASAGASMDFIKLRTQGMDPVTGLSELDRTAITRLSRVLTEKQMQVVKSYFKENTQKIAGYNSKEEGTK